ncbi:hypothetical protein RJ639_040009 [Escallonia herrerae]|uniref:Protein EDS1L-like n=1 Tax=Escallonia herrerae TaxID=1293975 RepID=A0AA88WVE9_9ASTE|nr:hypothetical protein RJ639_040009 [Escallonia herrerae]
MVGGKSLEEKTELSQVIINTACKIAVNAHKKTKTYQYEKIGSSSSSPATAVFAFSADHWFKEKPFELKPIDLAAFPSLRSIGNDEKAAVNESFIVRFYEILKTSSLADKVKDAIKKGRQIVFTGHSSAGPTAIVATLHFLEENKKTKGETSIHCLTFGSPLVGDRIFPHALRRENWARYFVHFVTRYDIVPRIMLAPVSSIQQDEVQGVLDYFNPISKNFCKESVATSSEATAVYTTIMTCAASVASHAACNLMGGTNLVLDTLSSFIELSPYRPFGTYIFCIGRGKLVVVENSDTVVQMLFHLACEAEVAQVAYRSLKDNFVYESELQNSFKVRDVVYLDHAEGLSDDLGLSTRARLCIHAAGELEKKKVEHEIKIDKQGIKEGLQKMQEYKKDGERRKVGYYDSFKLQNEVKDFQANVTRLELAAIWDEIIEMIKKNELPDEFEGKKEWIDLGTEFRRLVEPLDIANYYRHAKNEDAGSYMEKGRPKRYRFTQRWREHEERMPAEPISESCYLAEVEELIITCKKRSFEDIKDRILNLEKQVHGWVQAMPEVLGKEVFLDGSTFAKWWNSLPRQHKSESCLKEKFGFHV